jgi:hypothetical protein
MLACRPDSPRWPYAVLSALAFPFVGHAFEDGGPAYGTIYAAITLTGVAQAVWPTTLGWGALFLAFLGYGGLDFPGLGPGWQPTILAVTPIGMILSAFWFLRPWKPWPKRRLTTEQDRR